MSNNRRKRPCLTQLEYNQNGYNIVENLDGSVSLYHPKGFPVTNHENKNCCEVLGYEFNLDTQKCMWTKVDESTDCKFKPIRVVLNPEGGNSVLYDNIEGDECCMNVSFDYLFSFDCKNLEESVLNGSCINYIDIFKGLDITFNIEKLNQSNGRLETIYSETLFNLNDGSLSNYIINNYDDTKLLIEGDCGRVRSMLADELYIEYVNDTNNEPTLDSVEMFNNWFNSCWSKFEVNICDEEILSQINGESINISIQINNSCADLSIMLDRIKVVKNCNIVENIETRITEAPKFEFIKLVDNKKSWIANDDRVKREFNLKYRETEYYTNEKRLVINTKEIDLNLSPARAVEQDIWCYIKDNDCLLTGNHDDGNYEPYYCPEGYDFDTDNELTCVMSGVTSTIQNGNTYEVDEAYRLNRVHHYGLRGTVFVDDLINDVNLPIFWSGTPENTWVGPFYNTDYISDSNGSYLNSTGFGVEYVQGGVLRWSSPDAFSGFLSQFGSSESPTVNGLSNPNLLWGGTPGLNSMVFAGRLFNASIWFKNNGINGEYHHNKWVGISECIEITETKIYCIGFAGVDKVRVKLNGEWVINPDISPFRPIGPNSGFDTFKQDSRFTQAYVVLPVKLFKGKNVIEFEGFVSGPDKPAGFVGEVYDATINELKIMRTEGELNNVTIFSTKNYVGDVFDVVGDEGYFCPSGYGLDTCLPEPYQCIKISKIDSIRNELTSSCCGSNPITISGPDDRLIDLPTDDSGKELNHQNLINSFNMNGLSVSGSNCGEYYNIKSDGVGEFSEYLIVNENDGTMGVYGLTLYEGNVIIDNLNDSIDREGCVGIRIVLENTNSPNIVWDSTLNECVYKRCGDTGCVDLDELLTTEMGDVNSVNEFERVVLSELINVKNRQVSSAYPTLKLLYERYKNHSLDICGKLSSSFDYFIMDNFGKTVGNYWVDLIEQVIPATSLWNSTYEYRNGFFDQQKFKYKKTNLFLCEDPQEHFPFEHVGFTDNVDINIENANYSSNMIKIRRNCNEAWVMSNNDSNMHHGTVTVINNKIKSNNSNLISDISSLDE